MFTTDDYREKDAYYWEELKRLQMPLEQMLQHFPAFVRRRELPRFLAHYELFKHVVDLPGAVVEMGVFRGAGLLTWAKLMETFCPGDRYRKVYGFDWFKGLHHYSEKDGALTTHADKTVGGYASDGEVAQTLVKLANLDNLVPNIERCVLVNGNIMETLPKFLEEHPGFRVSLLHLDLDLYEPTKFALELLYPRVVKGGIIAFDEYGIVPWEGEARAAEEFFQQTVGEMPVLKKFPFSAQPHGYFMK